MALWGPQETSGLQQLRPVNKAEEIRGLARDQVSWALKRVRQATRKICGVLTVPHRAHLQDPWRTLWKTHIPKATVPDLLLWKNFWLRTKDVHVHKPQGDSDVTSV